MFSSGKLSNNYNQEIIFEYFNHILYGFTINREVSFKDRILIPIGYDN